MGVEQLATLTLNTTHPRVVVVAVTNVVPGSGLEAVNCTFTGTPP